MGIKQEKHVFKRPTDVFLRKKNKLFYRGLADVCDMTVFTRRELTSRKYETVELCLQNLLFYTHVFDFTCFYVNRVLCIL